MRKQILVPTDISIAEAKFALPGQSRRLTVPERIGLCTVPPLLRCNYVKQSRTEMRDILRRKYPTPRSIENEEDRAAVEILRTRQNYVHAKVVTRTYGLVGAVSAAYLTWSSFKDYDIKGQALPALFALYGGNVAGRMIGAMQTGRWKAPIRDVSLGNFPAKRFLQKDEQH